MYPAGSGPRGRIEDAPKTEKDPSKVEPPGGRSISAERISSKLPLIIVLVMFAIAAIAAAGLYMRGVFKI
jgi:hypothetical protein